MSDQEGDGNPIPEGDDYDSESQSDDQQLPSRWGHFDDENDEVNETFHTLMEDFIIEKEATADDPAVEDKYLQDHWTELMQYVSDRSGDFEPVCAGVALRLARRGQYGPEDEGTIPKPPLISGFPEALRVKALEDTQFSLDELKTPGSEETQQWENIELRQACLEMQLHLFSNGAKPAPEGFEAKMKAFLDQRASQTSPYGDESASEGEGGAAGGKRARSDDEEEEDAKKAKPN